MGALEDGIVRLTGVERVWYVIECTMFASGFFSKVPAKKALVEAKLTEITAAETFWCVFECIGYGHGYFLKISVVKAMSEMTRDPARVLPQHPHHLGSDRRQPQIREVLSC
jgi:hypothetical protein